MKIALLSHLASSDSPTGAEHSLAVLARGLADRGHEVVVTAPGPWALTAGLGQAGVVVETLPVRACWLAQYDRQPVLHQLFRAARFAVPDRGAGGLRRWLEAERPEVVYVNCLPHLRGAAVARSLDLPVVWHVREILPAGPRRRWFAARIRRDADRLVAVSRAVARWLEDEDLAPVDVVHNGVEAPAERSDPTAARRSFGLPTDAVVAGLFSQLVPHKGGLDFVRAAHLAAPGNPNLHFVIAGSGPEPFMARLRSACDQGPAADRFRLLPPQPVIWDLLAATDVAVLTTLWPDPLPRVVMEAMAAGLPVVAYDGGGVPEMVTDGETGLIVPTGDVQGLGDALAILARSEEDRVRLGSAGRRRALRDFTVACHVERMERVVDAAASGQLGPLNWSNLGR